MNLVEKEATYIYYRQYIQNSAHYTCYMAYPIYVPSDIVDTGFFPSFAGSFIVITASVASTKIKIHEEMHIYTHT